MIELVLLIVCLIEGPGCRCVRFAALVAEGQRVSNTSQQQLFLNHSKCPPATTPVLSLSPLQVLFPPVPRWTA